MSMPKKLGMRIPFEQVHTGVDMLMDIFHKAALATPEQNDDMHTRYRLATYEYLKRTGWGFEDFANTCEKLSTGQPIPNDAPIMETAIS
jgi:hypothetical protein